MENSKTESDSNNSSFSKNASNVQFYELKNTTRNVRIIW